MGITAKELAKKLNISEAAVSLALNNKPGVSTQTRKRVIEFAREQGYDFSKFQFNNDDNHQGSIYFFLYKRHGAVVTDTPFFSKLSEGIDLECKRLNYFLNIQYLYKGDNITEQLNTIKQAGAKGVIVLGTEMQKQDITPFLKSELPCVLLDNYFEDININSVLINNIQGAYTATDYMIQKCKMQPGYLHSSYSINNFEERADGFYKALRKNGMSTSRSIVHLLAPSVEGAYADMMDILNSNEPLAKCYFADNDLIAAGAIRAFKDAGYQVPKDISIIGFDDMPICIYVEPTLTTINVPKEYMGILAVKRLHDMITDSRTKPTKIEISTSLIKRKSC